MRYARPQSGRPSASSRLRPSGSVLAPPRRPSASPMPCSCGPCPCTSSGTCRCCGASIRPSGSRRVPVPYGAFKGFVDASPKTLSAVAGVDYHGAASLPVREGADGVNLKVALVTGNLFSVLGVTPLLGRNLQAEDDSIAAAPVVAISYELWQRRYGTNPSVLGRVLTIRGQPGTIVAVMPRGFGFPAQTEVWATARPFRPVAETGPPDFYVYLVGRLAPGATVEQSASELTNYLRSNLALLPSTLRGMTASAETFDDDLLGDVRPVIRLLLVASALVMLVAIVNVGALFLALGLTKRQELAVRVSLGATPRRLLLLAFNDALIVAAAGAVLGVAIAYGVVRLVVSFASTQLPRADAIEVNGVTLAFAVALAVVATVAFAIACVYGQRRAEPSRCAQRGDSRRHGHAGGAANPAGPGGRPGDTGGHGDPGRGARGAEPVESRNVGAGARRRPHPAGPGRPSAAGRLRESEAIQRRPGPGHRGHRAAPRRAGRGADSQRAVRRHVWLGCAVSAGRTGAGGADTPAASQFRNRVSCLLPHARHRDRPRARVHRRGQRRGTSGAHPERIRGKAGMAQQGRGRRADEDLRRALGHRDRRGGRHPLSRADGHSADGLPAACAVRGRATLSRRPHGWRPDRPRSSDSYAPARRCGRVRRLRRYGGSTATRPSRSRVHA